MKKGCLVILLVPIIIISLIIGYTIILPKKPATEEIKKEILFNEFNKIKNSEILNKNLTILTYL